MPWRQNRANPARQEEQPTRKSLGLIFVRCHIDNIAAASRVDTARSNAREKTHARIVSVDQ